MKLVETSSFKLATITEGDENSERTALVLPGRLDTKDYEHMQRLVEFLSTLGYYAMSFDPPGTWDSPGGIELFTTTNYIKAVDELIEHMGNRPTLLAGHSRGGTVVMLAGPKNPNVTHLISVNSSYGGPIDVDVPTPGEPKVSYRDLPPGTTRTAQQRRFDLPYDYFIDGNKYNALDGLRACRLPKLFFYGTHDSLSTPERVGQMYHAAAEPKMIHELDTEHDYRLGSKAIDEVNRVVGKFLSRYQG
ncbi:MAG TPA: alpha/beta hydrolase [Candidatus Saccharimonadales bacterium]|nr:alpha/beta hydrolase [Candidatus Saccharimonadales bacterium]